MLAPERVHVLAPQMVGMIDALLCFSVGQAERWATGHREQGRNKSGRTSKRFAAAKGESSWLCFIACSELKSEVKRGFSILFLFPQVVNHSLEPPQSLHSK